MSGSAIVRVRVVDGGRAAKCASPDMTGSKVATTTKGELWEFPGHLIEMLLKLKLAKFTSQWESFVHGSFWPVAVG